MIDFWTMWARFWRDFGSQDGSKIDEKSIKKRRRKNDKQRAQKKDTV